MNKFLRKLGIGMVKLAVLFVALAVLARFVPPLNWFFFQQNDFRSGFLTMTELEAALATGRTYDVLVMGSSACEYSLDPRILADSTGLSVFKFVTGGQTIDMSVKMGRFLAAELHPKFVIFDAFPRFGPGLTEEGVERVILNSPSAHSRLTWEVLKTDPFSGTTNYLWAARAIGTWVKSYPASELKELPGYEMAAPGFSIAKNRPPVQPAAFTTLRLDTAAIDCMNGLHRQLIRLGQRMVAILPPIQNGKVIAEGRPLFPLLVPHARPDTCFWDSVHMREECVADYSAEVARLLNALRDDGNIVLGP